MKSIRYNMQAMIMIEFYFSEFTELLSNKHFYNINELCNGYNRLIEQ